MIGDQQDSIFESLDRLAAVADTDYVGDRMPDIERRVRASRQRKGLATVAVASVLAVGGVGIWHGLPGDNAAPPVHQPIVTPWQKVSVNAVTDGSRRIQISYSVTGKSTTYTDPESGQHLRYAGPRTITVLVDGKVVRRSGEQALSCARGGRLTSYAREFGRQEPFSVPVTPGRHTVVVQAPYCADGVLRPSADSAVVTTIGTHYTVFDTRRADLDGDGVDEVLRVLTPKDAEADQQLQVTWGTGEKTSASFPNTMETTLEDPLDLDQDGRLEVVLSGGGGDVTIYSVYVARPAALDKVTTLDDTGKALPLESSSDPATWRTSVGPDGISSYRLTDPNATEPPFHVDVRGWVLKGETLTRSAHSTPACVVFQPSFSLGPC
jgi:hypothetical protein